MTESVQADTALRRAFEGSVKALANAVEARDLPGALGQDLLRLGGAAREVDQQRLRRTVRPICC